MREPRRRNERTVLALLRGADPLGTLPARDDGAAWDDLLALLRQHRLTALAAGALGSCRDRLPEPAGTRLRTARADSAVVNEAVARDGEAVLGALLAAGIPVAPLKGPWLAERLGVDGAARPTSDLDVLVPGATTDAAVRALHELGFGPDPVEPFPGHDGRHATLVAIGERW